MKKTPLSETRCMLCYCYCVLDYCSPQGPTSATLRKQSSSLAYWLHGNWAMSSVGSPVCQLPSLPWKTWIKTPTTTSMDASTLSKYKYNSFVAIAKFLKASFHSMWCPSCAHCRLYVRDTRCTSKQAIGQAVDLWYNESVDAYIGPPCSVGKWSTCLHSLPYCPS